MSRRQKVLYVKRFPARNAGTIQKLKNKLTEHWLRGQDGFLRGALHHAFDVTEKTLPDLLKRGPQYAAQFDALAVNLKSRADGQNATLEDLAPLARFDLPKILCVTNAEPDNIPDDPLLDLFDIVLKREMFKDRDRYNLTPENKAKLHTTMLVCPFVPASIYNVRRIDPARFGCAAPTPQDDLTHDVFFSGATTSRERIGAALALSKEQDFIRIRAALQPRQFKDEIPPEMIAPPLRGDAYINAIRTAAINLAFSGYGPFTFRHLELWALAAFPLSTPGIRDLELPMPAQENVHYAAFDHETDLIDKIRHYLKTPQERETIARNGRKLFEDYYSFEKQGKRLTQTLSF